MNPQTVDFIFSILKPVGVVLFMMLVTLGPFYALYLFIVAICKAVRGPQKGSDQAIERDGYIVVMNPDGTEKYRMRK